jgi:hypothetical protein
MRKNVYVRAQEIVRELPPLDKQLDEICAITWCLSRNG